MTAISRAPRSRCAPPCDCRRCAGDVLRCPRQRLALLIYDKYGRWALPKGHLEAGETEREAAVREVYEETGISCTLGALLGRISYPVVRRGAIKQKTVVYFYGTAAHLPTMPRASEGISAAEWVPTAAASARIGYPLVRDLVAQAGLE
ncbi:MAG: NUDIX domain-containing protein [Chloroflexaceae bacterium]|nr:NUDIX domain-containing protein [Chloroflexaceae bacterium]